MRNRGEVFEHHLYTYLCKLPLTRIWHEKDLQKKHGWRAAGVDFLLEFDSFVVPIQCKYRNTRRREDGGVHNFLSSVEYVMNLWKKPMMMGLWVSRMDPFDDNKLKLLQHNILTISHFGPMEDLARRAIGAMVSALIVFVSMVRCHPKAQLPQRVYTS